MLATTSTSASVAAAARQLTRVAIVKRVTAAPSATITAHLYAQQWRRTYATPAGPPPKGFRLPAPKKWDEDTEGTFDKLGKYFLLTEMARGMYLLLEQFFRPP